MIPLAAADDVWNSGDDDEVNWMMKNGGKGREEEWQWRLIVKNNRKSEGQQNHHIISKKGGKGAGLGGIIKHTHTNGWQRSGTQRRGKKEFGLVCIDGG